MTRAPCRSILALLLCMLATGCITSAEQMAARNSERCTNRGLEPNTKNFNDCLAQLENERDARMQARRQEMLEKTAVPSSNRGY